uniref:Acid-sensing ion channel 1 n=1 Tax=Malurus cyaneus samueli TaxID=2593467 RepID=A0A8C5T1E5_9PASS
MGEDGADEFLYGQKEDEEEEEDTGAATDFVAFASSCTLHGLSHIFVEGSLGARQALWALAFLLSLSVFLYQVADRIAYYLEYHHVTLLSEEDSPAMTFPAVTFCNINRVRLSQLSHEDLLYLAPLVDYEPGMELGFTPAQPGPWEEDEPLNLYGFFNRTCHQLEDMLLSCSYRGQRCGPGDFAPVSTHCPRMALAQAGRGSVALGLCRRPEERAGKAEEGQGGPGHRPALSSAGVEKGLEEVPGQASG